MRRSFAWLTCAVGIAWLFRRRRRPPEPQPAVDPAEELRRKLEESRGAEPPAPSVEPAEPETGVDERRRAVHERGRAAIDEMRDRGSQNDPPVE